MKLSKQVFSLFLTWQILSLCSPGSCAEGNSQNQSDKIQIASLAKIEKVSLTPSFYSMRENQNNILVSALTENLSQQIYSAADIAIWSFNTLSCFVTGRPSHVLSANNLLNQFMHSTSLSPGNADLYKQLVVSKE